MPANAGATIAADFEANSGTHRQGVARADCGLEAARLCVLAQQEPQPRVLLADEDFAGLVGGGFGRDRELEQHWRLRVGCGANGRFSARSAKGKEAATC